MKRSYSGYLYIVLCAVIFSTMEVMLKTVHGVFAPMQITCLRFLIGGLLLVPFALRSMKKKGAAFTRADVGFFALTGFLCVEFSMVLYQMAVTYTKASVVAIIFSCNPIFVTMLAYFPCGRRSTATTSSPSRSSCWRFSSSLIRCTPRSIPPARCSPLPRRSCFRSTA